MNHNHNGVTYADTRLAEDFLDAAAEKRLARRMLGMAKKAPTAEWDWTRATKCLNAARRKAKITKQRLDLFRKRAKAGEVV